MRKAVLEGWNFNVQKTGKVQILAFGLIAVTLTASAGYSPYVDPARGIDPSVNYPAEGFFRVRQADDGRWWLVNPLGHGMVVLGLEHVRMDGFADATGRKPIEEANLAKYGTAEKWAETASGRIGTWGFNFLGSGSADEVRHRNAAHTIIAPLGGSQSARADDPDRWILPGGYSPCKAMPNVFHPKFAETIAEVAQGVCAPHADDPWLVGWFSDNELAWWGRWGLGRYGLFDVVRELPAEHTARQALERFMEERGRASAEATDADKGDFVGLIAERYFAAARDAIRKADPNHLYLGARFAVPELTPDQVLAAAGRQCDVVSVNLYPWADLERNEVRDDIPVGTTSLVDVMRRLNRLSGRPVLMTEWSFSGLDSGLPCDKGVGARYATQVERAHAAALCARTLLALPFSLGYDFFMYPDEPSTQSSNENMNYGLVSADDEPYEMMTKMFTRLNAESLKWRRAALPKVRAASGETAADYRTRSFAGAKGSAPSFSRDGDAWKVESAAGFGLSGRIGTQQILPSVTWNGEELGSVSALASVWVGPGPDLGSVRWPEMTSVTDVGWRTDGALGILSITAERRGDEGILQWQLELTVRPDRPDAVLELKSLRNTGDRDIELREIFLRPLTAWKEDPANRRTSVKLYQPVKADAWESNGRHWGAFSSAKDVNRIEFTTRAAGGDAVTWHPDATFALPSIRWRLKAGATYDPKGKVWLELSAGEGGAEDFRKKKGPRT